MTKFISSISLVALLAMPMAASAAPLSRTTQWFDWNYKVSQRVIDRSLEPLVRYVHTEHNPITGEPIQLRQKNYEANMCVLERKHCEQGSGLSDCRQFTAKTIDCSNMQ